MNKSIHVSIADQRLSMLEDDCCIQRFSISTASKGVGQQYGSEQTPLGRHEVAKKIGAGLPANTVFVAREPTGEIYSSALAQAQPERDWILTRILWLRGLETGVNLDGNVDSYNRKIYIHASPEVRPMGEPHSHGCITLHNAGMLQLFEWAEEGMVVYISHH